MNDLSDLLKSRDVWPPQYWYTRIVCELPAGDDTHTKRPKPGHRRNHKFSYNRARRVRRQWETWAGLMLMGLETITKFPAHAAGPTRGFYRTRPLTILVYSLDPERAKAAANYASQIFSDVVLMNQRSPPERLPRMRIEIGPYTEIIRSIVERPRDPDPTKWPWPIRVEDVEK